MYYTRSGWLRMWELAKLFCNLRVKSSRNMAMVVGRTNEAAAYTIRKHYIIHTGFVKRNLVYNFNIRSTIITALFKKPFLHLLNKQKTIISRLFITSTDIISCLKYWHTHNKFYFRSRNLNIGVACLFDKFACL